MPSQAEIQKQITERIIDGLQNGIVPWRKPWRTDSNSGSPANVISRRAYSGINPILLDLVAMSRGYTSRHWGTYQQWQSLGAQVRQRPSDVKPGQWGCQIVFYKQVKKTKVEDGEEQTSTFPVLRTYTVFNIDQVDGESVAHLRASTDDEAVPLEADYRAAHEAMVATGADIRFGGDKAFYIRPSGEFPHHAGGDYIQMPTQRQFFSSNEFYSTAFHELAHWSEVRLGWEGSYAMGELVAEMASCYIAAQVEIPVGEDLENHKNYLGSWLKELQGDHRAIFKAASQASKATGFILGFSRAAEPQQDDLQAV